MSNDDFSSRAKQEVARAVLKQLDGQQGPRRDKQPSSPTGELSDQFYKTLHLLGKNKKESGLAEKPTALFKNKLRYPHVHLEAFFNDPPSSMQKLEFEHYIVGETEQISVTMDRQEREGRMELMKTISEWKVRSGWPAARSAYITVMRMLEMGKLNWNQDFRQLHYLLMTRSRGPTDFVKNQKQGKPKTRPDIWFCKDYNHGGCNKTAPHPTMINGVTRAVAHICAKCYLKSQSQQEHPESADTCPLKTK